MVIQKATSYHIQNVIIDITTGKRESTDLFSKAVIPSSPAINDLKAICWYPIDGSTDTMKLGIFDMKNNKNYKSAIGQSSLNYVDATFVWLEHNPLEHYVCTTQKIKLLHRILDIYILL